MIIVSVHKYPSSLFMFVYVVFSHYRVTSCYVGWMGHVARQFIYIT